MQDEIRPKKVAIAKVKSEENVADLGTKPPSKAATAKHCLALGYVNMAEENGQCKVQGVAMFVLGLRFHVRDGCQISQHAVAAGDHVKESSQRISSRNGSNSSSSMRTSSRRPTTCL